MAGYGGADLLLTSEWGRGMEVDLPERCFKELAALGVAPAAVGSEPVAALAVTVKPRCVEWTGCFPLTLPVVFVHFSFFVVFSSSVFPFF